MLTAQVKGMRRGIISLRGDFERNFNILEAAKK